MDIATPSIALLIIGGQAIITCGQYMFGRIMGGIADTTLGVTMDIMPHIAGFIETANDGRS